ncbi:hypothetical protein [Bradyrhizobium sp. dw_411]|uniref:hypothetical protein n=1 Tax=Bradyrhizobium sp. dw_411 TaxID=2720082 RepID=UPI001BCB2B51|nr:hypothetical protein [Bradyrhizobium sp. dw_411]
MPQRLKLDTTPFIDHLAKQKQRLEAEAAQAPPGPVRDSVLKRLRQLDIAAHLNEWLSSPGLRTPR